MNVPRTFLVCAGLFLVSVLTYANCVQNEFVFDGLYLIKTNPWITDVRYLEKIFTSSSWSFMPGLTSGTYRPVQLVMYMGIYHLFGLEPLGYHLFSIIFHSFNTLWIFFIFSSLLADTERRTSIKRAKYMAGSSALLFAVNPVHTENVTWAAGMVDPVGTFLLLTCFYIYMQGVREPGRRGIFLLLASWSLFFISLFLKEIALTFPAMLVSYDLYREKNSLKWRRLLVYLLFAAGGVLYLFIRYLAVGSELGEKQGYDLTLFQSALNISPLLTLYIGKFLIPLNLNAFYGVEPFNSLQSFRLLFSIIFIVIAGFCYTASFFRNRLLFFLLTWSLVPLIPVLYIPALGRSIFAERYLYLPGVSLSVLSVVAGFHLYDRLDSARKRGLCVTCMVLIASLYAVLTVQRNGVWKNEYTLWADTVIKSPDSYLPLRKMGEISFERGEWEKSLAYLSRAAAVHVRVMSGDLPLKGIHNIRGLAYLNLQRESEALLEFESSLKITPLDSMANFGMGLAWAGLGEIGNAVAAQRRALEINPGFRKAREELNRLLSIRR